MTALGLLLLPALLAQQPAQTYEERYREILNVAPRTDRGAAVSNLVLTRDVAQFTLTSGTLHLLSAVGGRTVGAVFRGAGTFRFEPPTQIERDRLKEFEGSAALDDPFTELVLFFADRVEGSRIPTYRVAYRTERGADNQYRVSLRIDQSDVPEDFQMPVLVTMELKDKRQGRYRVNVRGPRTEVTLPRLPAEPRTVKFNDLESVLADVKMVDW